MYSDPTGHKDYKPGEATADYYRGVGSVGMYQRPDWAYKSESGLNWDKWDAYAKENGSAELLAVMSDKEYLTSITGLCRPKVILEAKQAGETLSSKQIDFRAEGKAIQAILMSGWVDPDSVGVTKEGMRKVIGSTLLGVSVGVVQTAYKGVIFLPSLFEKQILKTDQLDRNSQSFCDWMDNSFLGNSQYIDKDAYNIGKPGGAAIFMVAVIPELAVSIPKLWGSLKNLSQLPAMFEGLSTINSGGALAWASSISVDTAAVRELVGSMAKTTSLTGAFFSSMFNLKEDISENSSSGTENESEVVDKPISAPTNRNGLRNALGEKPYAEAQAHHNLPWNFKEWFANRGLNVNDPQFGSWVKGGGNGGHQSWSKAFDNIWKNFINKNLDASASDVIDFYNAVKK